MAGGTRQQRIDELTTMLTKYFHNQQQTSEALTTDLFTWLVHAQAIQDEIAAQGCTHLVQRLSTWLEDGWKLRMVAASLHDTAPLAQLHLLELLVLKEDHD